MKFGTGVDYHMLISILIFLFSRFFHSSFWDKLCPKVLSSSDWLKFGTGVDYHMLISILMFIFSKFFSLIFLGQISFENAKSFRLTEIWYRGRLPYAYFDFNIYFFKILFFYILGAILVSISEVLQIYWNLEQS